VVTLRSVSAMLRTYRFGSATEAIVVASGRAGHPDRYYAELARRYAAVTLEHRRPVKALAAETGLSETATRNLVYAARKKGFLTPATPGQGGGCLTPKALAALQDKGED